MKDLYPRLELKLVPPLAPDSLLTAITAHFTTAGRALTPSLQDTLEKLWQKVDTSMCIIICGTYNTQKTTIREFMVKHLASQGLVKGEPLVLSTHRQVVGGMFGQHLPDGGWRDGVVALRLMESHHPVTIVLDGTFDHTVWSYVTKLINKEFPLILPNGKKVSLPIGSKIFIEVPDFSAVEPVNLKDFCIQRLETSHLRQYDVLQHLFVTLYDQEVYDKVKEVCHKYLRIFQAFLASKCQPLIQLDFTQSEKNFFNLFDSLIKGFFPESSSWKNNSTLLKKMGLFCSVWSVFPSISSSDQVAVDDYLRVLGIDVPVYGTVFDYFIDFESNSWEHWDRLTKDWVYDPKEPSSTIFIESKEYVKFAYFLNLLTKQGTNVLLLGPRGCGKSSIVKHFIRTVDMKKNHVLSIQICNNTSPNDIFGPLLKYMEKKTRNEMQPIGGKNLLLFLDDLDLNENSNLAEPLRFFKENRTWIYENELKYFDKVSLIGTECLSYETAPSRPTRSRKGFHYFYVNKMSEKETKEMYATIVKGKFWDFEVDIKFLTQSIVRGSINTYQAIVNHFQQVTTAPTISNTFFTSDIKKVICGVLRSHKDCHDTKFEVVQLWVYEVFRTFRDRMTDPEAEQDVIDIVREETKKAFNMDFDSVCEDEENFEPPLFGNILDTYGFYTDLDDDELLGYFPLKLEEYNSSGNFAEMDIIFNRKVALLFINQYDIISQVIQNTVRVLRVISEPGGHIVLSGESGNCRQSMVSSQPSITTIF